MTISKYLFSFFCNSLKIRMLATNFNYQDNHACKSGVKGTAMKTYINNTFHFQTVKWLLITGDFREVEKKC